MTTTEAPSPEPDQLRWRIVRELVWVAIALGFGWWIAGEWPTPYRDEGGFLDPYTHYQITGPNQAYFVALLALGWRYMLLRGWSALRAGGMEAVRVAVLCAMVGAAMVQVSMMPFDSANQGLFDDAMPSISAGGFRLGDDPQFILCQVTLVVMAAAFVLSSAGLLVAARRGRRG